MVFTISMPRSLQPYFKKEVADYSACLQQGNLPEAWHHLERAHVIGQAYPFQHTYIHWKMLQYGFRIKSRKEIIGQIPRLLVGGVKSFVGKIPAGNTGGANVPPLQSMPVSEELLAIFEKAGVQPPQ